MGPRNLAQVAIRARLPKCALSNCLAWGACLRRRPARPACEEMDHKRLGHASPPGGASAETRPVRVVARSLPDARSSVRPAPRPLRTAGRQLRSLRLAADLSVEEAAIAAQSTVLRIRELEAGAADLLYLEGLTLAKAYLMCASCFSKHFRLATARSEALENREETDV